MKIWRRFRREVATAWRSLRYDLRLWWRPGGTSRPGLTGRPGRAAHRAGATAVLPALRTAGVDADEAGAAYEAYTRRRPRRLRAAVGVAVLAVGGAAATYFGVVGGLSALLADDAGPPSALPQVTAGPSPTPPPPPQPLPTIPAPTATGDPGYNDPPVAAPPPAASPAPTRTDDAPPAPRPDPTPEQRVPIPSPAPEPTPTCTCPPPSTSPPPTTSPEPSSPPCDQPGSGPTGPPDPCDTPNPSPGSQAQAASGS